MTIVNEGNFYLCSGIVTGVPSVQLLAKKSIPLVPEEVVAVENFAFLPDDIWKKEVQWVIFSSSL